MCLIVVSGLPRSGTSMMMAALQAGGVELLADGRRPADEHNPGGYFEDARSLGETRDWLTPGKAVKLNGRLLYKAEGIPCKVILLRRDFAEIAASQDRMLGKTDSSRDWPALLAKELEAIRAWLTRHQIPFAEVAYAETLKDAKAQMARVAAFLKRPLDVNAMAAVVQRA